LAPGDFRLFGPLSEALGGKSFKLFAQQWLEEQPQSFLLKARNEAVQRWR
jgi:hypothetical protein